MSYFNHAFKKTFVGTDGFTNLDGTGEKLGTPNNVPALGQFGFVDKNWETVNTATGAAYANQPLTLFAGSIHTSDKIGPFAGGYTETVKSKVINPKYVSAFYRVVSHGPQKAQFIVGEVQDGNTEDPLHNSCSKAFVCGGSYNFRIDIKGSPALRFLTHNMYLTVSANGGCCADPTTPEQIDPRVIYTQWAYNILNNPIFAGFVQIQLTYSIDGGTNWLHLAPDATGDSSKLTGTGSLLEMINDPSAITDYISPGGDFSDLRAGMIINGAYVDTRFNDCTFYPNDSTISYMEPIKIYGSEVDLNGDPCTYLGLCMYQHCAPIQMEGSGESVIRSLIMTEAYMQQPVYTGMDLRIREITNGTDVFNAIDRSSLYDRYFIQHNVPRFNNPTSTFDNDQYLLEIITDGVNLTFSNFVTAWTGVPLTTYGTPATCTALVPVTPED
jgi:hypothetical protein